MPNITTTALSSGGPFYDKAEFEDGLLTFTAAGTVKKGTILARDSVSLKFVPFVVGGVANQNGIPKAVLTYEVVATASGDLAVRVGITGYLHKNDLIIHADGTGVNVTSAIVDQLRDYGIYAISNKELNF